MSIVEYREAPQNSSQLASSTRLMRLDTESGHVFDEKGNTIAKWTPRDDENTAQLADFAFKYASDAACFAMSTADKDRAQLMSQGYQEQLVGGRSDAQLFDLGVSDVHIPAALPNYAAGYRNAPPMADIVSPVLPVDKLTNNFFTFDKNDAFQRAYPSLGGVSGGAVPEISPRLSNAQYSCIERALGGRVSPQVEGNADAPLRIMQATIKRVMNAMLLEREFRTQSLLRATANWNSGNVATILAANKWNGGAGSDPLADIHARIEASFSEGVTGMLMSEKVFHAFQRNPAVRAYYGYKDRDAAVPTASDYKAILQLPSIYVSKMKFINTSGSLDYIWGGDVVLFRQPDQMPPTTQDDVATSYTFRWNAANLAEAGIKDGVASGGFIVRQFYEQFSGSMGVNRVVVVHQDAEVMTGKYVGGLLVNAYA